MVSLCSAVLKRWAGVATPRRYVCLHVLSVSNVSLVSMATGPASPCTSDGSQAGDHANQSRLYGNPITQQSTVIGEPGCGEGHRCYGVFSRLIETLQFVTMRYSLLEAVARTQSFALQHRTRCLSVVGLSLVPSMGRLQRLKFPMVDGFG